jgi:hypothetical protein
MNMRLRVLLVFSFVALCTAQSHAQREVPSVKVRDKVRILASGRLLGYFREPDRQDLSFDRCSAIDESAATASAAFIKELRTLRDVPDITLAAGDNFAPELLSRVLDTAKPGLGGSSYETKDRFTWEWNKDDLRNGRWVRHDSKDDRVPDHVTAMLYRGKGFIPADNVACFFLGSGFDVVVPGHHDFYFGAERLRMLARLMASPALAYKTEAPPAHAVQMLATNLVIRTTFIKERLPRRESPERLGFETTSKVIKPTTVADGDLVLPYARKFGFAYDKSKVTIGRVYLREADPNDPHRLSKVELGDLSRVPDPTSSDPKSCETKSCETKWTLPVGVELEALKNYGVCVEEKEIAGAKSRPPLCVRFSVDAPFFQYPSARPWGKRTPQIPYNDPEPFFVKRNAKEEVIAVVFGAVHPKLREHVGELNFAWLNSDDRYKTEIAVVEPARALAQALDYFEYWYAKNRCGALDPVPLATCVAGQKSFDGDKILVAQMPPPEARELGARVAGGFAVVVSEAETARATPNQEIRYTKPPVTSPTFLLVPRPAYDLVDGNGVDIRSLTLGETADGGKDKVYTLAGQRKANMPKRDSFCAQPSFQRTIAAALRSIDASAAAIDSDATCRKALYELSLYAMRRRLKTDVAVLQKRDFFFEGVPADDVVPPLGEVMKRILWKGDFLTELMVPGSTLKAVIKQGQAFDQDDAASLSLAVEKDRGILTLGIAQDTERKEYLVNGKPLEDSRLYTVATSDYAAQGDTGFPELISTAVRPTVAAHDFDTLYPIDEIVTADLAANMAAPRSAVRGIAASAYLDYVIQAPADTTGGLSWAGRVGRWFVLGRNQRVFAGMSSAERKVQDRPEVFIGLQKMSGSWSELQNNVSEDDRQDKFSGTVIPQLSATTNRALTVANQTRAGVSLRSFEFYASDDLGYSTTSTAQKKLPRLATYPENKAIIETGVFQRLIGKAFPHVGPQVSYRMETQLFEQKETFTLKDGEAPITRSFERSLSHIGRLGGRVEGRQSSIGAGYQRASVERPDIYEFQTAGRDAVRCALPGHAGKLLEGEISLADCVKKNAAGPAPLIDASSSVFLRRTRQTRNGAFVDGKLAFPLAPRLSFTSEHHFDWFKPHAGDSNSLIHVRYTTVDAFDWKIVGNLSFQPSVSYFVFRGQGVGSETFRQWKASMGVNYVFDWFAGNGPGALIRGK